MVRVLIFSTRVLTKALEKTGKDISKKAVNLARHAHRKTVRGEDVEMAVEDKF